MRKFTLCVLLGFIGSLVVSAQSDFGRTRSRMLHQLFSQSQPELRTTIAEWLGSKPDSSVLRARNGEIESKIVFKFEAGKETLDFYYRNDESESERDEHYFDENDNEVMYIQYRLVNGNWVSYSKTEYIFDVNGAKTFEYSSRYGTNGQWMLKDSAKIETVMSSVALGTLVLETYFDYSYIDGIWVKDYKNDYTYDTSGRELSNAYSTWSYEQNKWIPQSRESSEYNQEGKLILHYDENWSEETQSWYPHESKFVFHYDSKGRVSSYEIYEVDEETGTWDMTKWTYLETFYYADSNLGIRRAEAANTSIWSYKKEVTIQSESELMSVSIYNLNGNLLYTQQVGGTHALINGYRLYPGLFIVNVRMTNGLSKTAKIVIR